MVGMLGRQRPSCESVPFMLRSDKQVRHKSLYATGWEKGCGSDSSSWGACGETPRGWRWVLGPCRGDTPEPGGEFGVAEMPEPRGFGASPPPGLGSPRIPDIQHSWDASPCGFLSPPPFLGFCYPKAPLPQILSLSQARVCGCKSRPYTEGESSSDPSWQDFGGRMSPRGCCPQHSPGGPGPPPALWPSLGSENRAAEAPGPGQPAAPKLQAAFLRTTGPHQGVSQSTRGRQQRCPGVTPQSWRETEAQGAQAEPELCPGQGHPSTGALTRSCRVPRQARDPKVLVSPMVPEGGNGLWAVTPPEQDRDMVSPQHCHSIHSSSVPQGWLCAIWAVTHGAGQRHGVSPTLPVHSQLQCPPGMALPGCSLSQLTGAGFVSWPCPWCPPNTPSPGVLLAPHNPALLGSCQT